MLFDKFTRPTTKVIQCRMDVVKSTEAMISYKAPMGTVTALMLLLRRKTKAESRAMVQMYHDGGLVCSSLLMIASSVFNVYFFHVICDLLQDVRDAVEEDDLKLDYTEIFYYFSVHKLRCKKFLARCLLVFVDVVIIFQGVVRAISCLVSALHHIAVVANHYGNDFTESSLCWFALIPVLCLLLIGNYKMLAIVATVGNCAALAVYIYMFVNCSKGINLRAKRKLFPTSIQDVMASMGSTLQDNCISYTAISVRQEMRRERDFDKCLGTLNWTFVILNIIHILLPGLCYVKYGTPMFDREFKNFRLHEMGLLLIALEQVLTIAIHMYIPFHIIFPALYQQLRPKHVVRMEIFLKVLIAVFLSLWAQFLSHLDVSQFSVLLSGPLTTFILPPIYQLADGKKHGICKKIFNILVVLISAVQVVWTSYYCFKQYLKPKY